MEDRFDYQKNESPLRHIRSYAECVTTPNMARVDMYAALETLVANELELDGASAEVYLETSQFAAMLEYEDKLAQTDVHNKDQLQSELYAILPLILLWNDIRELRTDRYVEEWLKVAVDLVMVEAEAHNDDECEYKGRAKKRFECNISPCCPAKMLARILGNQAVKKMDPEAESFVGPQQAIGQVSLQLMVAKDLGLITEKQANNLREGYMAQRPHLYPKRIVNE